MATVKSALASAVIVLVVIAVTVLIGIKYLKGPLNTLLDIVVNPSNEQTTPLPPAFQNAYDYFKILVSKINEIEEDNPHVVTIQLADIAGKGYTSFTDFLFQFTTEENKVKYVPYPVAITSPSGTKFCLIKVKKGKRLGLSDCKIKGIYEIEESGGKTYLTKQNSNEKYEIIGNCIEFDKSGMLDCGGNIINTIKQSGGGLSDWNANEYYMFSLDFSNVLNVKNFEPYTINFNSGGSFSCYKKKFDIVKDKAQSLVSSDTRFCTDYFEYGEKIAEDCFNELLSYLESAGEKENEISLPRSFYECFKDKISIPPAIATKLKSPNFMYLYKVVFVVDKNFNSKAYLFGTYKRDELGYFSDLSNNFMKKGNEEDKKDFSKDKTIYGTIIAEESLRNEDGNSIVVIGGSDNRLKNVNKINSKISDLSDYDKYYVSLILDDSNKEFKTYVKTRNCYYNIYPSHENYFFLLTPGGNKGSNSLCTKIEDDVEEKIIDMINAIKTNNVFLEGPLDQRVIASMQAGKLKMKISTYKKIDSNGKEYYEWTPQLLDENDNIVRSYSVIKSSYNIFFIDGCRKDMLFYSEISNNNNNIFDPSKMVINIMANCRDQCYYTNIFKLNNKEYCYSKEWSYIVCLGGWFFDPQKFVNKIKNKIQNNEIEECK